MKRKVKKHFIMLFVLFMVTLTYFPIEASAATDGDFKYSGTTLTKYTGDDATVYIPLYIETIAPKAFCNNDNIKMVYIHDEVEKISNNSFYNCPNLKKAYISQFAYFEDVYDPSVTAFTKCSEDLTIYSHRYSDAEDYAETHGLNVVYMDDISVYFSMFDENYEDVTKKTLYVGKSFQTEYHTINPYNEEENITFISLDKSVATVTQSGKIKAVGKGQTSIIVRCETSYDIFKVTVKNPTLNKTKVTLNEGKTTTLKITGGVGTPSYSSSNKNVATVNSKGKITAKKKGTAVITVKTNGMTLKCNVTVKRPAPYLKWKSYEVPKGSSFKNELYYKNKSVKWSSTNKKVATVDSTGKVKGVGFGTCYIKATSNGKTYSCKVKVYRLTPNYRAYISNYDTRNNRFQVKFQNDGKRDLIVYSKNAKALDDDYKSYDRDLRLKKGSSYIVVKAGTSKLINFYVKGSNTWPDEDDFTIRYYIKYHGKEYKARVRSSSSRSAYYREGDGWYTTYWVND